MMKRYRVPSRRYGLTACRCCISASARAALSSAYIRLDPPRPTPSTRPRRHARTRPAPGRCAGWAAAAARHSPAAGCRGPAEHGRTRPPRGADRRHRQPLTNRGPDEARWSAPQGPGEPPRRDSERVDRPTGTGVSRGLEGETRHDQGDHRKPRQQLQCLATCSRSGLIAPGPVPQKRLQLSPARIGQGPVAHPHGRDRLVAVVRRADQRSSPLVLPDVAPARWNASPVQVTTKRRAVRTAGSPEHFDGRPRTGWPLVRVVPAYQRWAHGRRTR